MKDSPAELIPIERITKTILVVRGHKVMLDVDLADLYGVSTKRLNEQVKRNKDRFPDDFMFQLSREEKNQVVAIRDHLDGRLKYSPYLPYVFTEYGALMLANVIKSDLAIGASIQIVRAFVNLRELVQSREDLARKLHELENKYDKQIKLIVTTLNHLMVEEPKSKRTIGFKQNS